jgi:AcrR family transcriptional regulator
MSTPLPTEAQVRSATTESLKAAAGGGRPTATALAARLGISRPALYRNYRPLVDELLAAAAEQAATSRRPRRGAAACNHQEELAGLRRANGELRRHVTLYEEIIRQLAVDNAKLRNQLEQQVGVVPLGARRRDTRT